MVGYGCDSPSDTPTMAPPKKAETTPEKAEVASEKADETDACAPKYRALSDHAVVAFSGTGDMDITVVTDPLCWHCRLGHKLLGEYPEKYGTVKMLFFPRASFIGSDMAAWVLEDAAGADNLRALVDFAYTDLKLPKTKDLAEARMIVLLQFTTAFPQLLDGTTMPELYVRMQQEHEQHVLDGAALANSAELPGTPILIAGKRTVLGYGAKSWVETLDKKDMCE